MESLFLQNPSLPKKEGETEIDSFDVGLEDSIPNYTERFDGINFIEGAEIISEPTKTVLIEDKFWSTTSWDEIEQINKELFQSVDVEFWNKTLLDEIEPVNEEPSKLEEPCRDTTPLDRDGNSFDALLLDAMSLDAIQQFIKEKSTPEEPFRDEFSLDTMSLDELSLDELPLDEMSLDELSLDAMSWDTI